VNRQDAKKTPRAPREEDNRLPLGVLGVPVAPWRFHRPAFRVQLGLRTRLFLTIMPLVVLATALLTLYLLQITRDLYLHGIED
jgi:hypothetical protein